MSDDHPPSLAFGVAARKQRNCHADHAKILSAWVRFGQNLFELVELVFLEQVKDLTIICNLHQSTIDNKIHTGFSFLKVPGGT